MKVLVVVPAYNEAASIKDVVDSLQKSGLELDILVINDCSTDATARVLAGIQGISVIDLSNNLGIGGAVQTGLKYACRNHYDAVIQFDGDGQHISTEIPKILGPVEQEKADVVIGSRFSGTKNIYQSTAMRRCGIQILSWVIRVTTGKRVLDVTSGFRAYGKNTLNLLCRDYPTDYPEPEAILMLAKAGMRIEEVPVEMCERMGGQSSIPGIMGIYYMIKVILALLIASMRKYDFTII